MEMLLSVFVFAGVVLGIQTLMSPAYRLGTGRRRKTSAAKHGRAWGKSRPRRRTGRRRAQSH